MSSRRAGAWWRRRWCVVALVCGALAALVRVPAAHNARAHFPHTPPHRLAHLLADFSHQPLVGSWTVVEDRSNYTSWSYVVQFSCGARCAGRARVVTREEAAGAAPQHGLHARAHHVALTLTKCEHLPLLPWPILCDEMESESAVWAGTAEEGGGAWLATLARTRCGVLGALGGACAERLRAHHDAHVTRLRAALLLAH